MPHEITFTAYSPPTRSRRSFPANELNRAAGHDLLVLPNIPTPRHHQSRRAHNFIDMHTPALLRDVSNAAKSNRTAITVNALMKENGKYFNTTLSSIATPGGSLSQTLSPPPKPADWTSPRPGR